MWGAGWRRGVAALCLVLLVACGPDLTSTASPEVPTFGPASPAATPEPSQTPGPSATAVPLMEVSKLAEGPHGFPSAVEFPANIVVNYVVQGTCTFTIDIRHADAGNTVAANLSRSLTGGEAGAWHVSLDPGQYLVVPGEAVGCTFTIDVYPA